MNANKIAKFWSKTDVGNAEECWPWVGRRNACGYGTLSRQVNKRYRSFLAHRVSYEITCGEIPLGKCVLHTCDNPACVNPKHLFVGTHDDNMKDMARKGRAIGSHTGEKSARSKLTWRQVCEIRISGYTRQVDVADWYGVSQRTVSLIRRWDTYKYPYSKVAGKG